MKTHFITYGSNAFEESARKIVEDAKGLGIFKEFRRYTPEDLPLPIKSSPLFLSGKGGGHWLWKPYIIHNYLQKIPAGDTVVYADSGCILFRSRRWETYFDELKNYDALFFQYKDHFDYGWKKFNNQFSDSPKIKYWAKQELVDHFKNFDSQDIIEKNKLLAGFCLVKNSPASRKIIQEWLYTMLFFPHLVADPMLHETQRDGFAQHRHDQAVISIIARIFEQKKSVKILDEDFETENPGQAMLAVRRKIPKKREPLLKRAIKKLKRK